MTDERLDFVSVGDITTDAFIKITDAYVVTNIRRGTSELRMNFGDKLPYEEVVIVKAVGNSPNAAVSAHRLGLRSALVTDLGDDQNGKDCLEALQNEGVLTDHIRIHPNQETNYHYVLQYQEERTILVKHHQYDYNFPIIEPSPKWIYLSSLAENSLPYHGQIADYLKSHPETKLAFQPGTFQMRLGQEALQDLYHLSSIFFCNREEAGRILQSETEDMKELLKKMHASGPKIAVITDGPKGSYAYDGEEMWYMPMYPDPKPPVDRTGAGDSFSSTFVAALILGKSIPEALSWGPINSMSVVQYTGAQAGLLTREQLEHHLANAPDFYRPERIN
jgi:ribokinase